jgi:isoleucyl-tRNA synthetase
LAESFGDELRFLLIVSDARIAEAGEAAPGDALAAAGFRVSVRASEAEKCVRCWHRREDVGSHANHPELCGRCVENVDGPGETRRMT